MKCLAVLYALWLSVAPALAAPARSTPPMTPPASIRSGETLDVQVAGESGLSKSYTVDAAGRITLDMVGQVLVAGRTTEQVAAELRTRLSQYLKEPTVTVTQSTPARQEILVTLTGEVLRPAPVKLRPGDGLIDALAAVGGLASSADGARATLVRRGQAQPQPLNVERLLKGDLSQNLTLNDGDIIQVPKKEIASFQIVGEVRLPGSKRLDGNARVLDALIAAGGLTERADRSRVTLTRKSQAQPIVIDLDKVIAGESSANVVLQPEDVLSVASRAVIQVAGEVRAPGERLLRSGATLMEAILLAGGFGPDADRAAVQINHHDGATETVNLADVTAVTGGPVLRPGDLVLVGRNKPDVITLIGAVHTPGPMRYQSGMKVTDALMAAGLVENAMWKQIRVIRGEDGPGRKILMFNLEAYLKAPQTQNLPLQAGDRIFVEARRNGSGKTLLRSLMEYLPLANLYFLTHP